MRMYLAKAGFDIDKPNRDGVCGRSRDGRIEFIERDRRIIPHHIAGAYDAGITGLDLVIESGVKDLRTVAALCFARASDRPTRWVLAKSMGVSLDLEDLRGQEVLSVRVGCELPFLASQLIGQNAAKLTHFTIHPTIRKLEGHEEMAPKDGLCELVLVVTETGRSMREHNLTIVPGCEELLVSMPQIIAKPQLPASQEEALQELRFALEAVIGGASRVMMKADLPTVAVHGLALPAEVSPTVSSLALQGWSAIEVCIPRSDIGPVGLKLERAGARGIVVQEVVAYATGNKSALSPSVPGDGPHPNPFDDGRGARH